jgi:hypothetical protein
MRKLSALLIILVALLQGALWIAAYFSEAHAPAAATGSGWLDATLHSRQFQAAALAVAAPIGLVAAILVLMRSRWAIPFCLVAGAYAIGSLLLVMRASGGLIQHDETLAWVYGGICGTPLLLGCIASLFKPRETTPAAE